MELVDVHEAKTRLSKLVEQAIRGKPFVIAKAGKPMVKVMALDTPTVPNRIGFLEGQIRVPDDFDSMGTAEVAALFSSGE
jgi:prevent-host-death family protein